MEKNAYTEQFGSLKERYSDFIDLDPMRNDLHYPAVFNELGDVSMKRILDVGCGDGLLDQKLAEKGAIVSGYDKAPDLVSIAQNRTSEMEGVTFIVSDPENFNQRESFDEAVSVMVLCYSPDEKYLPYFFKSTYHALNKNGRFIAVTFNPKFKTFDQKIGNRMFSKKSDNSVQVSFLNPQTNEVVFTSELNQFSKEVYENSSNEAGFKSIEWKPIFPTKESKEKLGEEFWNGVEEEQPYILFTSTK